MTEVEQPPQNGIDLSAAEDDDSSKARPADIEQDMREMERRKRVEAIMSSKLFREELERIVDSARDGATGILQQLSDIVGVPVSRVGSMFKASSCMMPINDIRGVESMGYAKGEKILRCKLAATFRLLDLYGWTQGLGAQITARLKVDQEYFLVNPYGLLYHEITASALNKVDMQGHIVEQGTTNFGVNKSQFVLHSVVHAARPDIRCAIYIGCSPVVAISSIKAGLLPLTKDACVLGEVTTFSYTGSLFDEEERDKLVRNLGPNSKVMLLTNYGALCCGETIEEAFFAACHIVQACETQLKLLPIGVDNLVLIPEESRKVIYEHSRRPPEDLEKKFAATATVSETTKTVDDETAEKEGGGTIVTITKTSVSPKWRVGGAEFEALMRMLDNAGFRTGYIYRHPLVKSEPPKPKSDVELPPAVSSLGYLLEEEELFRQGIWKKGDLRKGGDRSRWLNSPNVYQKVEVLETGTPDPKKITKWVAEGSPTHSTPVRIEDPLQFVPPNTNPKEFKRVQQQIKENRRADKISAGPQSHILEGVTWDEANRIKDATVSSAGDHVVLVGAASKGIIQRGYQHNATVYKAPYAKNPFDNVTDDELNEYKRTVERKKKSIHGEYTDTDFSESEALSSQQTSGAQQHIKETTTTTTTTTAAVSQSEPEDVSEHHVMRIETQQAPIPSQPEVVLSDANQNFINGERSHMAANRKPSIGRDEQILQRFQLYQDSNSNQARYYQQQQADAEQSNSSNRIHFQGLSKDKFQIKRNQELIKELKSDSLFQRQKEKHSHPPSCPCSTDCINNGNSYANSLIYSLPYSNQKSRSNTDCYSPHLYEPFSYYGADNNRNLLQDDDYHLDQSLLYDETNDNSVNATVAPYDMIEENSYKKSAQCSTPNICETIFRSLHKPRREFVQQNLIWNIPFSHSFSTSPASMPEINYGLRRARVDSPQKSCKLPNQAHKRQSPYRTVSHFGFKSPQRFSKPDHKHVPAPSEPKKYVPLRRSISYEEIFSSPRYVDLCEHCFEQIVRLKPELMSYRAKLRNLAECPIAPNCPTTSNANNTKMVETGTGANLETLPNSYDLETVASEISEPIAAFSSSLEPLLEVEERESSDDRTPSAIVNTKLSTINSFIEKISSMSFSEEPGANYLSARLTSKVSIPILNASVNAEETRSSGKLKESADETFENEAVASNDKVLEHQEDENVRKEDKEDSNNCNSAHFVSITEIWEFGDWMDSKEERVQNEKRTQNEEHASSEGHLQNAKSDLLLEDTDEKNSEGITSTKTQTDEIVTLNKAERVSLSSSVGLEEEQQLENFDSNEKTGYSSSRSLTNRTDQEGRNIEFQELWGEDHITNCENREQGYSSTFSDDGSAIEGHQQQNFDQDRESFRSSISQNLGTEVFHGHSLIIRSSSVRPLHKIDYSDPNEQTVHNDIHLSQQSSNDDCHSSSHRTFSLSEPSSSNENLLIRSYGCTNLAADFAYRRIERRSCERTVETFIGNKRIDRTTFEDLDNVPEASSTLDFKRSYGSFEIEEKQSSEVNTSDEKEYDKAEGEGRSNEVEIVEVTDAFSDEGHNVDEEDKYIYELESVDDRIVVNDGGDDDHDKVIEREWDIQSNVSDSSEYISQNVENLQIEKIDEVLARNRSEATLESNDPTQVQEEYAESEDNLQQFSTMEREILKKIELHQLNKSAEIFNKIESSIRNKLTPSKLELLVKQNSLGKSVIENTSTPQVNTNFHTSTPTKLEDHEKQTNSTEQTMMGLALNEPLSGENVQNGDHSEAHLSTFSHSSKEDISTDGSPKKDKKKKKGLRTPSFLKKKKEKKKPEA